MRIIRAGYQILPETDGANLLRNIERIARVCYKSEDKIGDNTYRLLIDNLVKRKHLAMLEHGSIIIECGNGVYSEVRWIIREMEDIFGIKSLLRFSSIKRYGRNIVSGNLRMWLEFFENCIKYQYGIHTVFYNLIKEYRFSPVFDDILKAVNDGVVVVYGYDEVESGKKKGEVGGYNSYYIKELFVKDLVGDEMLIHYDLSVLFAVDRGVSHEIVRHRLASFAQESTRYCNYGHEGEITVIEPCYLIKNTPPYKSWAYACEEAETVYMGMLQAEFTPQQARAVLPNSLKTEIVVTANLREWRHILALRACGVTGKPHPQMMEVMIPLLDELKGKIPVIFDDLEVKA